MYSSLFQLNSVNRNQMVGIQPKAAQKAVSNPYVQSPVKRPSFAGMHHTIAVQTQLNTNSDIQKYSDVVKNLDVDGRKAIDYMLKTGTLLNNKSNDRTTTLDNLHKIISNPRAKGLEAGVILNETVKAIANPFVITQKFGDIPSDIKPVLEQYDASAKEVKDSGCCVAASIEFNLANQLPAEFARVAEGLSSESMSSKKDIDLSNLCEKREDSIWLLDNFKIPYTLKDNNKAEITIAPDKNAIIRANIQTNHKDAGERSAVDVLMQSTFMNVGSQQTYNTLNDKRVASFGTGDRGLVEIEKTFTESVVTDSNKTSLTFQKVETAQDAQGNPVAKLAGYNTDFNTVKSSLLNAMASGQNVIIGYTFTDEQNTVNGGHEITVVGAKQAADGKLIFVCNDTDDELATPVEYHEDYLIPRIHHVGLPTDVVNADTKLSQLAQMA